MPLRLAVTLGVYLSDSILQMQAKAQATEEMRKVLRDEMLEAKLIPSFGVGCKRLIPDVGYLEVRFLTRQRLLQYR